MSKNFGNLFKQAQKMQAEMIKIQNEAAEKKVEASVGGGMVTVVANGKQEILSIEIDPEVISSGDTDMLKDLIIAAVNEALRKSKELFTDEVGKLTGGMNIPGLF